MKYSLETKKEIVLNKNSDIDVRTYCKQVGISYSTYYKWAKEINYSCSSSNFIDVTSLALEADAHITLSVNDVSISITSNYDELLLAKVINTLRKL